MGDVDEGHAAALDFTDQGEKHVDLMRGQRRRRFIENEHAHLRRDGLGDRHQLLLGDAQACDRCPGFDVEVDPFQQGAGVGMQASVVDQPGAGERFASEEDIFRHGQMWDEIEFLEDHPDPVFLGGARTREAHVAAIERECAGVGLEHAGEDVHQGGFARAVLAEQGEQAPATGAQVNAVERAHARELPGDPGRGQNDVVDRIHQITSLPPAAV